MLGNAGGTDRGRSRTHHHSDTLPYVSSPSLAVFDFFETARTVLSVAWTHAYLSCPTVRPWAKRSSGELNAATTLTTSFASICKKQVHMKVYYVIPSIMTDIYKDTSTRGSSRAQASSRTASFLQRFPLLSINLRPDTPLF